MSSRARIPVDLPNLPGNTFHDPRVTNFAKPQTLHKSHVGDQHVRDVPTFVRPPGEVAGGAAQTTSTTRTLAAASSSNGGGGAGPSGSQVDVHPYAMSDPAQAVAAGRFEPPPPQPNLQGKILIFYTYFLETVHESAVENYRVRQCRFLYYLEDDTMEVIERNQPNSGMMQGHLIKRHRIPKGDDGGFYHFSDFALGREVPIYGKVFRIVDADDFTKEFFGAMSMEIGEAEEMPPDAYAERRSQVEVSAPRPIASVRADPVKKFFEASLGKPTHLLETRDKFSKFLANDRKVLKFWCQWDESENRTMFGEIHSFLLLYFLSDDTLQVLDLNRREGKDPWLTFIKRQRVPKAFSGPGHFGEREPRPVSDFYSDADLRVGHSLNIYGRNMLLNSCDQFTKEYLMDKFSLAESAFEPVYLLESQDAPRSRMPPAPHDGYGTEEDSLQNTKFLIPKPPKKDLNKFIAHDKKVLRWSMVFADPTPENSDREFILQFFLADDTLSIMERKKKNSGRNEGVFLKRAKVRKNPLSDPVATYWQAEDFQVGMDVTIHGHRFHIVDVDEFTTNVMVGETARFRHSDLDDIMRRFRTKLYEKRTKIRDCFRDMDISKTGEVDFNDFKQALIKHDFLDLTEHEMLMLFRRFAKKGGATISYEEFVDEVLDRDFVNPGAPPRITPSPEVLSMTDAEFKARAASVTEERATSTQLRALIKNIRDILFLKRSLFTEALHDLDPKHTGFISRENLIAGIRKFGVAVSEPLLDRLIEHVYLDMPGGSEAQGVNYQDFLAKVDYYGRGMEGPRY